MQNLLKDKVKQSLEYLRPRIDSVPAVAIILGSGLGQLAESIEDATIIATADIPFYPVSTVPGHEGRWIIGRLESVPLLAIQGRIHYYEGYSLQQVTYPIHLLANLGIKILILTTACGALNPSFRPGDLMLMTDQINFGFSNPLIGRPDDQLGPRFPNMSRPFDPVLIDLAERAGQRLNMPFKKGVFCWVTGPAYETAAEVHLLRTLGGDAVSMSTAPEVIVARQRHLRVLGISLITNLSTGLSQEKLTHQGVTDVAQKAGTRLGLLLREFLKTL